MFKQTIFITFLTLLLTACGGLSESEGTPTRRITYASVPPTLPVAPLPQEPTPTGTSVMTNPWTPTPIPSATAIPTIVRGLVVDVISAEVIVVVLNGDNMDKIYPVRLLGVDAPENVLGQPWGKVAMDTLSNWIGGRVVRLEQDVTVMNDAGELPRYVYLDDLFINHQLIEQGLAQASFVSPDLQFQSEFADTEATIRTLSRGLWGPNPTPTLTPEARIPTSTPTITSTTSLVATPTTTETPTNVPTSATGQTAPLTNTEIITEP